MRGRKEHVDMLFGDVKMMTTPTGEQYLKILQLYHENSRFPPSFKF
jgi:hypothetical protein